MDCSVAQCLEVVGEWWSLLIVRDAFLGVTRFDDFQRRLGISRNVLQQRLGALVDAGVLVKVPYSTRPPRSEYRLTPRGKDLWPVLTAMRQWGDRYAAPDGPPVRVIHSACGSAAPMAVACTSCGAHVTANDVAVEPVPGRPRSGSLVRRARSRAANL